MEIMIKHKVMTDYGIEADVWKVGYISLDRVNKYGSITMCLYLSEEATQYVTKVTEVIMDPEKFDEYFENGGDIIENSERFMKENCELFTEVIGK